MPAPIDVRRYGTAGPPVVVLHGGPGAPGSVGDLAAALGDEFRVVEPLQWRAGGARLTVAGHVDDLVAVTDGPVSVVGWSWGAMLGLTFAARRPELVRALVLVGCGTYDEAGRAEYARRVDERLGPEGREAMTALRVQLAAATTPEARDEVLARRGALAGEAQAYAPLPGRGDFELPADAAGHEQTWADVLRLQADGVQPAEFAAIRAPVLMLHGDTDPHPGAATADVLRAFVPQLEYVELARCGHAPWRERHACDDFFAALRPWLRTHP